MNPYVGYENIIPLLESKDIAANTTASAYMNIKGANYAAFLLIFGAITSATATDTEVVTLEAATAEGAAEAAIAFNYRLSGALGANTWGAITAATSSGLAMASTDDNKLLWIEVDPEVVHGIKADANYLRVKLTATPDMGACLIAVIGITDPIYKQTTHDSATASASA